MKPNGSSMKRKKTNKRLIDFPSVTFYPKSLKAKHIKISKELKKLLSGK